MQFDSQATCTECCYPYARTNADRICQLCYETIQEETLDTNGYYRPLHVEGSRVVLSGNVADYAPPLDNYGCASTPSSVGCSVLAANDCSCKQCHAVYGHKITCPLLTSNVIEAFEQTTLTDADKQRLHSLGVIW